jgi:multiple sugar transport system permease protein
VAVLATLMIPFQVRMVPLYVMFSQARLLDTYLALVLPFAFSGFGIFLMRQFIQSVPTALIEAARIDGAGELTILFRVVLPLLKPGLASLTIFSFQGNWDSFLWPLIVVSSSDMRTLPLGLAKFTEQYVSLTHLQMAGSVITTVPIILVFFAMQKQFIQGIALSGVKG